MAEPNWSEIWNPALRQSQNTSGNLFNPFGVGNALPMTVSLQDKTKYYNPYLETYQMRKFMENLYSNELGKWYPYGLPDMYSNPSNLSHLIGRDDYYWARHVDYALRQPLKPEPDYYLNYGHKYANRFKYQTRQRLSPQGQKWLDLTFLKLQYEMENKLKAEPYLEYNANELKKFAFGTHPDAYINSGLFYLPSSDWGEIFITPNLVDMFRPNGIVQIFNVLWEFKTWLPNEAYNRTFGELENYLLDAYSILDRKYNLR